MDMTQPIAFIDLETTGVSVSKDRICSISVIVRHPDGTRTCKYMLLNPEMLIPLLATDVHGITNEMVADAPVFKQIAKSLAFMLQYYIIAGYNSNDFDIIVLAEEFARCDIQWPEANKIFLDAFNIFRKKEPRDLVAALKFYCDEEMVNAHNAEADTIATEKIFFAQLERYPDLKEMTLEQLADFCKYGDRYDLAGKFAYDSEKQVIFNFGKHIGKKAIDVFKTDKYYYTWMQKGDFTQETLKIAKDLYEFANPKKK